MALYVNTNINSLIAQRSLNSSTNKLQSAITRLSTGMRVNQAGDDAAGLCVAQGLETQIRGNKRAQLNIQDGLNMMYIAEGGMSGVTSDLQRVRELCVQAANGVYSPAQLQTLMNEINERLKDVDVIANTTSFNGVVLTNGTAPADLTLQSGNGANKANNTIVVGGALTDLQASSLGVKLTIVPINVVPDPAKNEINGNTWKGDDIRAYIDKVSKAIDKIAENRSSLGAFQNRLTSATDSLATMNENYDRSKSQIMDADMAEESANMVKYQVLQQTSAAMLTQANQIPSIALKLLGQ